MDVELTQPQWDMLAMRDNQVPFPLFTGGYGCVHPDTKIVTDKGLIPISDITRSTHVLSWNEKNQKFQFSLSGGSFPRGRGKMYRVLTTRGEFVSSEHHLILSSDGTYLRVGDIFDSYADNGELPFLHQKQNVSSLSLSFSSAQHCLKTDVDYLANYAAEARLYGQQFLGPSKGGQGFEQQSSDVPESSHLSAPLQSSRTWKIFDKMGSQGHIHPGQQSSPLSSCRLTRLSQSLAAAWVGRALTLFFERIFYCSRVFLQSVGRLRYHRLTSVFFPLCAFLIPSGATAADGLAGNGLSVPPEHIQGTLRNDLQSHLKLNRGHSSSKQLLSFSCSPHGDIDNIRIIAVTPVEDNVYYDMNVANTNNYVCENGFVHHNCGKSFILAVNVIRDMFLFRGCKVGVYAPTHDLLSLNIIPVIEGMLENLGLRYSHNKQQHIIRCDGSQIIFRSMNDPGRIVAYEVYASHVDEADLMATRQKGEEAWNRIIGRNRQRHPKKKKTFNQVCAYSTPEGFKFTYHRWKKAPGVGYKYVTAQTNTNWNLDKSFILNLEDTYTPAQCKAYLMGQWTNIFTGSVYSYYDRDTCRTDRVIRPGDVLHIGQDFNFGGCCGAVYINEGNSMYLVGEHATQDTEQLVQLVKDKYADKHRVIFYPDATGKSNATNASESDIAMIKQANFQIKAKNTNPRIVDRINSVQRLLYNKRFYVNDKECPKTVEALEEHAYNDKTGLPDKFAGPATIDDRNDGMGYACAYLYPIKKIITKAGALPI